MKTFYKLTNLLLCLLVANFSLLAQAVGDFQTTGNVNFAAAANWQRYNGTAFVAAGAAPSSTDGVITIKNGHTATIAANKTLDQVVVANGGTLTHTGGTFTIANGTGDDIIVENGGIFILANNPVPTFATSATMLIKTGGTLRVDDNSSGDADSFASDDNAAYTGKTTFEDASIFEWNTTAFTSTGVTYFPNANASTIPIFRIISAAGAVGGGAITTINGTLEVNGSITWQNAGNKIFRNGITGTGTVTQSATSTSGQFQITGTNAKLGGTGTINLNSNGLLITSTADVSMTSNKPIGVQGGTPTFTVAGILDCATFNLTNASGTPNFTLNAGATLKIGSPQGITTTGATGNIQLGGTRTYNGGANYEYKGTAAQVTGNGLPATLTALLTINNTAATPTVTQTAATQTLSGTGSQMILTAGNYAIGANSLVFQLANVPITRTGGKIATIATSNITFGTAGNLTGNSFTLPNDLFVAPTTLNNFTVNRTNDLSLGNQGFSVAGTLSVGANGAADLDLNGNDIDLGTTGTLSEDRPNSRVVTDKTATTYNLIKGGYLRATARNLNGTNIAGLGIDLSNGTAGTVNIDRYHCKVVGVPVESIKKVFDITASVAANNATMRIFYSPQDLVGTVLSDATTNFRLHRGQNGITAPWTMQTSPAAIGTCHDIVSANRSVFANNITSFSPWSAAPEFTILPVTLLDFKVKKLPNDQALVTWQTTNEQDHKGFEVLQSSNGVDFQVVGYLPTQSAKKTTLQLNQYEWTTNCKQYPIFFKLKQIDHNEKFVYSPIIQLANENQTLFATFEAYPNPFGSQLYLQSNLPTDQAIKAVLTDLTGKQIWSFEGNLNTLQTNLAQNSTIWNRGTYILQLLTAETQQSIKVVKN